MQHIGYYGWMGLIGLEEIWVFTAIGFKRIFQLKRWCEHHREGVQDQRKDFRKQAAGATVLVLILSTGPTPPKLGKLIPSTFSTKWAMEILSQFSVHESSLGSSWDSLSLASAFTWVLGNVPSYPHSSFHNTTFPQGYSRAVHFPFPV